MTSSTKDTPKDTVKCFPRFLSGHTWIRFNGVFPASLVSSALRSRQGNAAVEESNSQDSAKKKPADASVGNS